MASINNGSQTLTDSAQARLLNINYTIAGVSLLGGIAGVVYSNRTGGGFWRGVGYYFLGAIAVGVTSRLVALPFQNKIIKDGAVDVSNNGASVKTSMLEYGYV